LDLLNAEGAEVAPLILDGTTMIPVRALSYAFKRYITLSQADNYLLAIGQNDASVDRIEIYSEELTAKKQPDLYIPQKISSIQNKTPRKVTALSDPAAYVVSVYLENSTWLGGVIGLRDANGNRVYPLLFEGTYCIPIRATAALFGCNVAWDSSSRTVVLTSTPTPPLFGEKEYISIRYPTKEEREAFDNVSDIERNKRFLKWFNANAPAITAYTTTHYGGWLNNPVPSVFSNDRMAYDFMTYSEGYSTSYGAYPEFSHFPWYESEPIETLAKTLVGASNHDTSWNIFSTVINMLDYQAGEYSWNVRDIATLSGNPPYLQACESGSMLLVAMLKAVDIPAVIVHGVSYRSASLERHALVACLTEEGWIFCDWTFGNQGFNVSLDDYKLEKVSISGTSHSIDHPLDASYYLNYVE
jgi:hypothetical protein